MRFSDFIQHALETNQPEWNYYQAYIEVNPLTAPELSSAFIRTYFQNGQKGFAVADLEDCLQQPLNFGQSRNSFAALSDTPDVTRLFHLSEYRAVHIVSAFFLGIFLESCFPRPECGIQIRTGNHFFPFSYLWFLTCLYHDYGYIVEENWEPQSRHRSRSLTREGYLGGDGRCQLEKIKRLLNITIPFYPYRYPQKILQPHMRENDFTQNSLSSKLNRLLAQAPPLQKELLFVRGTTIKGLTYSKTMLERYFSYGIHELKKPIYNHGIIGGYLFYDRMLKNYLSAYENRFLCPPGQPDPYSELEEFEWNGKWFSPVQIPLFAHIADCIIAHNIWKADRASEQKYIEYGLKQLVGDRFEKVSLYQNPLLFILAVVDTLDPYKVYGHVSKNGKDAVRVWKAIDLSFHDGRLLMRSHNKCYPIQRLYEKAKELELWVDVSDIALFDNGKTLGVKILHSDPFLFRADRE